MQAAIKTYWCFFKDGSVRERMFTILTTKASKFKVIIAMYNFASYVKTIYNISHLRSFVPM